MKNKIIKLVSIILIVFSIISCNHNSWFERDPQNIITDEQLWKDPNLIIGLLANYYNRLPHFHGDFNTGGMCELDDAMWSGHRDQDSKNNFSYGDSYGRYWDYTLIRDVNLGMENLEKYGTSIDAAKKTLFMAEMRFIRAFVYFEHVKRMGGVPLVTHTLEYDFNGDPSYLQMPRSTEADIYDFIYDELESIKSDLAGNNSSQTRANTFAALALESRSMLYAASLAKYNNLMAVPIKTEGAEVGIPASRADEYYRKSLDASKTIIAQNGSYDLYTSNANKGENFYDMLNSKNSNKEIIFAKDYLVGLKVHRFAYDNIVKSMTEDNESSSSISPSLSFVESFDYLDGSEGKLKFQDENGNYITYEKLDDIFADKDARLYGTVIYPGTTFKGISANIQAGVAKWNGTNYDLSVAPKLGDSYTDGSLWTGLDGPSDGNSDVSNTGFYIRKFVSNAPAASTRGTSAANWWPWFRVGEVYLNAAEAAFELNDASAIAYINKLRERAGFAPNSISILTMDIIRNERRVELAFEDHRYFDLKRWRIAHEVWNGDATDDNAMVHGLYPYRVVREGHPDDGKYIYVKLIPSRFKQARYFRLANYYSSFPSSALSNNPLLVKNPYH